MYTKFMIPTSYVNLNASKCNLVVSLVFCNDIDRHSLMNEIKKNSLVKILSVHKDIYMIWSGET